MLVLAPAKELGTLLLHGLSHSQRVVIRSLIQFLDDVVVIPLIAILAELETGINARDLHLEADDGIHLSFNKIFR